MVNGLNNLLDQRQSQTRSRSHVIVGFGSVKLIEHKREVLGGDSNSGVIYANKYLSVCNIRDGLHGYAASLRGVLHRIAQQIQ